MLISSSWNSFPDQAALALSRNIASFSLAGQQNIALFRQQIVMVIL
jgi:hypothetical protein